MLTRMQSHWNSYALLVGRQNCRVSSEKQAISYEVKHILSIRFSNHPSLEKWKVMFTQKPAHERLSLFIITWVVNWKHKLETTQMSFSGYLMKLWYIYTVEYHKAIKREDPLIYTTWMNGKGMLSERSQSQKVIYCVIPLIWQSWKDKTVVVENRLVFARG